jgi:hypothetical protein
MCLHVVVGHPRAISGSRAGVVFNFHLASVFDWFVFTDGASADKHEPHGSFDFRVRDHKVLDRKHRKHCIFGNA